MSESIHDRVRQLLEQAEERGYLRGLAAGYAAAKDELEAIADALENPPAERTAPSAAAQEAPPPVPATAVSGSDLTPSMRMALDYLRENPGVTAWHAKRSVKGMFSSQNFYILRDRGYARQEGSKFFAVET
jgi:hypothetical protein